MIVYKVFPLGFNGAVCNNIEAVLTDVKNYLEECKFGDRTQIIIQPFDMSEEDFNNLSEFEGP